MMKPIRKHPNKSYLSRANKNARTIKLNLTDFNISERNMDLTSANEGNVTIVCELPLTCLLVCQYDFIIQYILIYL